MASKAEKTVVDEKAAASVSEAEAADTAGAAATTTAATQEAAAAASKTGDEESSAVAGGEAGEKVKSSPDTEASADEGKPPAVEDDDRSKRVYIGNLAWEVSWQDLKDHIKSMDLDVLRTNIITGPDGRSKGCGIAEFATADAARAAVTTLNHSELHGRQIFVREDREDRSTAGAAGAGASSSYGFSSGEEAKSRRVYVGNLSWDVAWQDLKDHMRMAGDVVHAEVITEYNGRSKGCGIVEFATEEEAQEAIKTLTDTELKGRMIFVREDRESSSQSGHSPAGPRAQNTSVYVWNLSPETSWQDLKDHMRKAGNVDSATILTNAQGESIGCGVVVYQRPQEAARAIRELQNSELNGRSIYAREDRDAGRSSGGRSFGGGRGRGRGRGGRGGFHGRGRGGFEGTQLYVGNLAFETTWKELKDHFRQCGDIRRAEVATGPGGQSKGFGTVQFSNKEDAEAAIARLNGSELQGRTLEVRLDPKPR